MGWVRLDDGFPMHPKVFGLTDGAFRAYVAGLCYASQFLTDGWIPAIAVAHSKRAAAELVTVGLWVPDDTGTGFHIHDYLAYQSSRAEVEERRKRQSAGGREGARRRWHSNGSDP